MDDARYTNMLGKKSDSIWQMNKAQLAETARKELGMTLVQAQKETATVLRERLRRLPNVEEVKEDPLATLRKGLEKKSLDDLKEIHQERSLLSQRR